LIEETSNENEMNIEKYLERVESGNVETKNSRVEKNGEQIMKKVLQKLHVQRKIWRSHKKNSLCWAFYCVNDGKEVEVGSHQVMTHEMYYVL
jgi:hypothetical protein